MFGDVPAPVVRNEGNYMSDGSAEFLGSVRANQQQLRSNLKSHYDFIVCGSGSSGSVVARRLAEDGNVSVLLVEAGGDDVVPSILEARLLSGAKLRFSSVVINSAVQSKARWGDRRA